MLIKKKKKSQDELCFKLKTYVEKGIVNKQA